MIISTAHSLGNEREQGKIMLAESFSKCPNVGGMDSKGLRSDVPINRDED